MGKEERIRGGKVEMKAMVTGGMAVGGLVLMVARRQEKVAVVIGAGLVGVAAMIVSRECDVRKLEDDGQDFLKI